MITLTRARSLTRQPHQLYQCIRDPNGTVWHVQSVLAHGKVLRLVRQTATGQISKIIRWPYFRNYTVHTSPG